MKRRLLAIVPAEDATAFWRSTGTLSWLRDDEWSVVFDGSDGTWASLIGYDAVFIQRPAAPEYAAILDRCRMMNIPTWIDYDDDLLNVPLSNPAFAYFQRPETRKSIQRCLELATRVSVSTEPLRQALGRPDAKVIRNAWNTYNLPFKRRGPADKVIAWRGSSTHDEDLLSQAQQLAAVYDDFPDYRWVFFGGLNWQLARHFKRDFDKRVKVYSSTDPMSYLQALQHEAPQWMLVSLKDNAFNRSKSDIAWLEATWAGAACIAPDMPEWDDQSIVCYGKESAGIYGAFAEHHQSAKALASDAVTNVQAGRTLVHGNAERLALLRSLK